MDWIVLPVFSFRKYFILHSIKPRNNTGRPKNNWVDNTKMNLEPGECGLESTLSRDALLWTRWENSCLTERISTSPRRLNCMELVTICVNLQLNIRINSKTRPKMKTSVENNVNYANSSFNYKNYIFVMATSNNSIILYDCFSLLVFRGQKSC